MSKESKYERQIKFNLKVAVLLFSIITILNLVLPVRGGIFFRPSPFSLVAVVIDFFAVLAQRGYLKQRIPFVQLFCCRALQGGFYAVAHLITCNWRNFAILVGADIVFVVFLLLDMSSYCYIEEEEE